MSSQLDIDNARMQRTLEVARAASSSISRCVRGLPSFELPASGAITPSVPGVAVVCEWTELSAAHTAREWTNSREGSSTCPYVLHRAMPMVGLFQPSQNTFSGLVRSALDKGDYMARGRDIWIQEYHSIPKATESGPEPTKPAYSLCSWAMSTGPIVSNCLQLFDTQIRPRQQKDDEGLAFLSGQKHYVYN